jgi:rRNA small subunit pseudouridine methyltransferase Nep1
MVDKENRSRLSIILADSELELVPEAFWSHPSVSVNAKKRKKRSSQVLLDTNLHHSMFKDHVERNRRGRPDIVHQFLLIGLESILNKEDGLDLYVHTRNDELITISRETRMPKNYNRYYGLFEELLRTGAVPAGKDPLIRLYPEMNLASIIEEIKADHSDMRSEVVLMHENGIASSSYSMVRELIGGGEGPLHLIVIIGGFPSGDLRSDVSSIEKRFSLYPDQLKAWAVEMEILSAFYNFAFKGIQTSEEA